MKYTYAANFSIANQTPLSGYVCQTDGTVRIGSGHQSGLGELIGERDRSVGRLFKEIWKNIFLAYNIKVLSWIDRRGSRAPVSHSCTNLHWDLKSYVTFCVTKREKLVPPQHLKNEMKREYNSREEFSFTCKINFKILSMKPWTNLRWTQFGIGRKKWLKSIFGIFHQKVTFN